MREVERAFEATSGVVLGKKLAPLLAYERWLLRHVPQVISTKSALSNEIVYVANTLFYQHSQKNFVKVPESLKLGERSVTAEELESLSLSNAAQKLGEIRYLAPETEMGDNSCVEEVSAYANTHFAFRSTFCNESKYIAYCYWPRESDHIFGSTMVFSCSFCINCYHSEKLVRCFEMSDCANCSDCLFCHNCEGLSNCMFCFNCKGKKYAIGNVEVGRERYLEIKKKVLEQIGNEMERTKGLRWDIYNISCAKGM